MAELLQRNIIYKNCAQEKEGFEHSGFKRRRESTKRGKDNSWSRPPSPHPGKSYCRVAILWKKTANNNQFLDGGDGSVNQYGSSQTSGRPPCASLVRVVRLVPGPR